MTTRVRRSRDRGLSESVQWALLAPLVILTIVGIIQAGIILSARNAAQAAAMSGAEAQALAGSAVNSGTAVATRIAAGADIHDLQVTTHKTTTTVTVIVTGRAPVFLDFGQGKITVKATAPLEEP